MSAAALLDRLDRVKKTGPHRYTAGCPVCQSRRGRPISARILEDGRVLLHAFCGCTTETVLGALGLELRDLFEQPLGHQLPPSHSRIPARDLLALIDREVTVATLILADVLEAHVVDEAQWSRLARSAARIAKAHDYARG